MPILYDLPNGAALQQIDHALRDLIFLRLVSRVFELLLQSHKLLVARSDLIHQTDKRVQCINAFLAICCQPASQINAEFFKVFFGVCAVDFGEQVYHVVARLIARARSGYAGLHAGNHAPVALLSHQAAFLRRRHGLRQPARLIAQLKPAFLPAHQRIVE